VRTRSALLCEAAMIVGVVVAVGSNSGGASTVTLWHATVLTKPSKGEVVLIVVLRTSSFGQLCSGLK
jgi:hypothetical protein